MTKQKRAEKARKSRLKKRILSMLEEEQRPIFLTFTFSDKTLEETNEKTRLRAVKKYLNEQAKAYILNCDYGSQNEREHYHAIATPKAKIFLKYKWRYGYLKYNLIELNKSADVEQWRLNCCRFLENHATKETTKGSKIIYSRSQPKHKKIKYGFAKEAKTILSKNKSAKKERLKAEKATARAYLLSRKYNDLSDNEKRRYKRNMEERKRYEKQLYNEA